MDWITTTTLLQNLAEPGNEEAWLRFVRRFRRPIVSFARSFGLSTDDAEDAAQETFTAFLSSYRDGGYDRERGLLRSWLFGIAHKKVLKLRQRRARAPLETLDNDGPLDEKGSVDLWNEHWDRCLIEECVARARVEFSGETFRVFELVVLRDLSPQEAATEMGVPLKTVYNGKHRVLKRMREMRAELDGMEIP